MTNGERSKRRKRKWRKCKLLVQSNCKQNALCTIPVVRTTLLTRAKAEPVLEAARQALENIDKGQLTELKSFASPPETVKFVMNMVGECERMQMEKD